jgi:hypothetical protein
VPDRIWNKEMKMSTHAEAQVEGRVLPGQRVEVTVNGHPLRFEDHKVIGADVKSTAIQQGVAIQADFTLFEVKGPGKLKQIGDTDTVTLHEGQSFRAVAPDDNS